jgi:hypothetical protein
MACPEGQIVIGESCAEAVKNGLLDIASKPFARLFINDQDTGRYTPVFNFGITSGNHKITLKNPEHNLDKTYFINVLPGERKKIIHQ